MNKKELNIFKLLSEKPWEESQKVIDDKHDGKTLTLSREKTLNAWTSKMRKQICKVFSELKKKKHIKAIIITGSGNKAFCSGQDLNEIKNFKSNFRKNSFLDNFCWCVRNIFSYALSRFYWCTA